MLEVLKGRAPAGGYGGGCGHGGCGGGLGGGLFSKLHGGGGGLFSKLCGRKQRYAAIVSYPVTTVAIDQCGCGNSGQYFDYAVGAEYGTAGMQSSVAGSLTGACSSCGDFGGSVLDGSMNVDAGLSIPAYDAGAGAMAAPMMDQGIGTVIEQSGF